MTPSSPVARRRTFAIISHPDAGKTTLTEKILLYGGAIQLAGEVRAKANRRQTRSDWMGIERERGISVVTSVMTFEYGGCVFNLLGHARPRGLLRGHLPHADRGRLGGDGDRRRQGHRGAHAQAVRGLPAARHPDRHLHQQDGPRDARSVRPARRDREDAGARHRAARLDGRARPRARRRLRHPPQDAARARQGRRRDAGLGPRRPGDLGDAARARARRGDGGDDARRRRLPPVRQAGVPRRASDAGAVRQRAEGIRRAQPDRRDGRVRAAAARAGSLDPHGGRGRAEDDRLRLQDPSQHGPQPSRPHRLHPHLLGQADARHARQADAHRQADHPLRAAVLLRPGSLDRRRGVRRRRRRHPQSRPAAHRRHLERGRGPRLPRRAELRARNCCAGSSSPTR